jgi:hypothetical protein
MKRLIAIAVVSFLMHAGIAHALADCLDAAAGVHGGPRDTAIDSSADLSHPEAQGSANLHCADLEWQFGFSLRSSGENASRSLGKKIFRFAAINVPHIALVDQATPPRAFLTAPQSRAPIYIDALVLRI